MLFGVISGVIVGFTLTAAKTWTGLQTPRATHLALLACLWCTARMASLSGLLDIYSAIDTLALSLATILILTVLLAASSKRNLVLASVLILLSIVNITFHRAALGLISISPVRILYSSIALVVTFETILAGRVVPAFSVAANPASQDKLKSGSGVVLVSMTALGLCLWVANISWLVSSPVLACAAVLQVLRWFSWARLAPFDKPILWVLHVSYAWVPIGLGLLAASQAHLVAQSPAIHALTVGSMGCLVIGMMTRTARGYTGRVIKASSWEVASYVSIATAAVVRMFSPLLFPQRHLASILISGVLWTFAFKVFLIIFAPWLVLKRVDGREG